MEIAMDVILERIASYLINRGRTVPSLGMEYDNKFIFFLGLLFCSLSITATAGNRILNVSLTNGCPYDTLTARFGTSDGLIFNHAVCVNNEYYQFTIPDSTFLTYGTLELYGASQDDSLKRDLNFATVLSKSMINNRLPVMTIGDGKSATTLYSSGFLYWENADTIHLKCKFMGSTTQLFPGKNGTVTKLIDSYIIDNNKEASLSVYAQCAIFSGFRNFERIDVEYGQYLKYYMDLIKENPESRSLIAAVVRNLSRYEDIEDVKQVLGCFSPKSQQSHYGKAIAEYIQKAESPFQDILLSNSLTGVAEKIIPNPGQATLIVFSASWCRPCHKLIPLLREIHDKVNQKIDVVYVSTDAIETMGQWEKMLVTEKIPWRSLSAGEKGKEVSSQYNVEYVPYTLLVYPDKHMVKLDVREEKDLQSVYELFNEL